MKALLAAILLTIVAGGVTMGSAYAEIEQTINSEREQYFLEVNDSVIINVTGATPGETGNFVWKSPNGNTVKQIPYVVFDDGHVTTNWSGADKLGTWTVFWVQHGESISTTFEMIKLGAEPTPEPTPEPDNMDFSFNVSLTELNYNGIATVTGHYDPAFTFYVNLKYEAPKVDGYEYGLSKSQGGFTSERDANGNFEFEILLSDYFEDRPATLTITMFDVDRDDFPTNPIQRGELGRQVFELDFATEPEPTPIPTPEPEPTPTPQPSKMTVCHNGQEIQVPDRAVRTHVAHGDSVGNCPYEEPEPVQIQVPEPDPEPTTNWEQKYYEVVSKLNTVVDKLGEVQQENQTLKDKIENLNALVLEQVRVIYKWVLAQ